MRALQHLFGYNHILSTLLTLTLSYRLFFLVRPTCLPLHSILPVGFGMYLCSCEIFPSVMLCYLFRTFIHSSHKRLRLLTYRIQLNLRMFVHVTHVPIAAHG